MKGAGIALKLSVLAPRCQVRSRPTPSLFATQPDALGDPDLVVVPDLKAAVAEPARLTVPSWLPRWSWSLRQWLRSHFGLVLCRASGSARPPLLARAGCVATIARWERPLPAFCGQTSTRERVAPSDASARVESTRQCATEHSSITATATAPRPLRRGGKWVADQLRDSLPSIRRAIVSPGIGSRSSLGKRPVGSD